MKIYRISFWKSQYKGLFFLLIIPLTIGIVFYSKLIIGSFTGEINPFNNIFVLLLFLFLLVAMVALIFLKFMEYNYIMLSDDRIIIKRLFFPFLSRAYRYSEVEDCILGNFGGVSPNYLQFRINGRWTAKWINKLGLVDEKDYTKLIADLNSKGIEVFKKDLK